MNSPSPYILIATLLLIASSIYFINGQSVSRTGSNESITVTPRTAAEQSKMKKEDQPAGRQEKQARYELAKEVTTPDGFINTNGKPLTMSGLIGKKVILIDFWTYSCINCQRTTPYLNAWYEKYKDKGLVIVGLHTPEFEFEKNYDHVKAAVEKLGIQFPVVLDNDYSTWIAYKNQYWPRKYLIDIDGYIVYDHIGEGGYEETEHKIQEALAERMTVLGETGTVSQPLTKEVAIQGGPKSPETYFGSARNDQQNNLLFPNGSWNVTPEFAQTSSPNARIVYTYTAQDLFFVAEANTENIVEVLIDGKPLGAAAGADMVTTSDGKTMVKIKEARLYKIIQGNQSETHRLELRIQKPGLKAFTLTFG